MLAVQATERGHVPHGGPIKFCAPHKNFTPHISGSWVASQQGWHGGERSIHKEKLNRFNDVPDHLCVCCQTSKKILVEMRSVSALHLEMHFLARVCLGFLPILCCFWAVPIHRAHSVQEDQAGLCCFTAQRHWRTWRRCQTYFSFSFFFFSPNRFVWRMRTVGIDMICFIFWEVLAVTTTK